MPTQIRPEHAAAAGDQPHVFFIQCRIPTELYEWMRLQGFLTRRSMTRIVWEAVAAYRVAVEAGQIAPERGARGGGQMVKMVKYNVQVKDDLHEWLRTTAFHARTSISAMVLAALARAYAAQTEGTTGV